MGSFLIMSNKLWLILTPPRPTLLCCLNLFVIRRPTSLSPSLRDAIYECPDCTMVGVRSVAIWGAWGCLRPLRQSSLILDKTCFWNSNHTIPL